MVAKNEAECCIQAAVGGRKKHALLEAEFLETMDNMEARKELNLFIGKCPEPDKRGSANISVTDDPEEKNYSKFQTAIQYYTSGMMPSKAVALANGQNICEQREKNEATFCWLTS